jgi:protocatechuate 3,4-dioxygenase beta subunit
MNPSTSKSKIVVAFVAVVLVVLGVATWRRAGGEPEPAAVDEADVGERLAIDPRERAREPKLDLNREAKATISGTVRVRGGGPVAGASVCAEADGNELFGLGDGLPICTTSGADGHYRLERLWPVATNVGASAVGHQPGRWKDRNARGFLSERLRLHAGEQREGIDIELLPGGSKVTGVVKDISGGEVEGALVRITGGLGPFGGAGAFARTDENGRFELWTRPGAVGLEAIAEGYATGWTNALAPTERAELFLTPESVLIGRVVHAQTGEPVADVTVTATDDRLGRGLAKQSARSDADGNFRIGGLQPGAYKPTGRSDHVYGQVPNQVHLGLGQTSDPIEIRVHPVVLVEGHILVAGSDRGCGYGSVVLARVGGGESLIARTDDEGHVALRGVLPGEYEVTVTCMDMLSEPEYPNLSVAGEDLTGLVWPVREGLAMRGVVVDSSGAPVPDMRVAASMQTNPDDARGQTTSSWSGASEADGSFELAGLLPGTYKVGAWGELPSRDEPLEVELSPGADRNDVRIELPGTGTIRGRVVDARGVGQANVEVMAGPLGGRKESRSRTDDQGNFVIEHVRVGEARVLATADRWGQSMRTPGSSDDDEQGQLVTVAADATVEVELIVESRDGVIRGKVLDESGQPVDDAFVSAQRISEKSGSNGARERGMVRWGFNSEPRLSDADGNFTIDGLAPGRYMVHANRKGGGEALAEDVALGSTIELTITATGVLGGVVRVEGGSPPERFSVSLRDPAAGLYFSDSFFRTDGRWQLSELPAGSYEITVTSAIGDGKLAAVLEQGASITDLELVLESRVTVRGRLIDGDTQAPVPGMAVEVGGRGGSWSFNPGRGKPGNHVSDAQGRFEVANVATGKVFITISPRGPNDAYEWTNLARTLAREPAVQDLGDLVLLASRTKPGETAGDLGYELAQHPPGAEAEDMRYEIALVRPGGPAEAAGLVVGDVIEAVDGRSVVGEGATYYRGLVGAPAGTVLSLTLAGGKTVELTLGKPR